MPLIVTLAHVPLDSHLCDQPAGVFEGIFYFLTFSDLSNFPLCLAYGSTRAQRFIQETYQFLKNYYKVRQHPGGREEN